jgi:thiol:disulfide interchange protein DsbD
MMRAYQGNPVGTNQLVDGQGYKVAGIKKLDRTIGAQAWLMLLMFAGLVIPGLGQLAHAGSDYLDPEVAFKFSAKMVDSANVEITFDIAEGYYMYRDRFFFKASGAKLGTAITPPGKVKFDETFQKNVETYRHTITIRQPVEASGPFALTVTSQGCADRGLCYSPMESEAKLSATGGGTLIGAIADAQKAVEPSRSESRPVTQVAPAASEMGTIEASLKAGKLPAILGLFLLLGLGLSFTPCVLPMVPILSSIIVGDRAQGGGRRGLLLAAVYSLGMAIVYTALGVAAGLIGEGLSASLQNPWVLGAFAILMAALSLSMFGVYELQVPAAVQLKLMKASEKQRAGKLVGVFVMGALSALIVGPCVAAPLAGALVYISQTRDVVIGGSALFALAVGMSVPLLLVGVSAGALLPRAGKWMVEVKRFFGVLMLGVALWMVSPIIPTSAQMLGWALLGVGYGSFLLWSKSSGVIAKAIGIFFVLFGAVQFVGVASGARDPFAPLAHLGGKQALAVDFKRVKSSAELDAALANAGSKAVMLDFYADWCVSCKEMEKLTFVEPKVNALLSSKLLLQIDVTANTADDKAMLKRFGLFGPPGIIFFDKQGKEIPASRVIGYQSADKFLESLARAGAG